MQKIAISIDETLYKVGNLYYADNVCYDIISRYSNTCPSVLLFTRVKCAENGSLGIKTQPISFPNVEVVDIPYFNTLGQLVSNFTKIVCKIKQNLKGISVSLVRMPSVLGYIFLGIKPKKCKYGLEVVANPYDISKIEKGIAKYYWRFLHFLLKRYCAHADGISYVTKYNLQERYPCKKKNHFETYYSSIELNNDFFYTPDNRRNDLLNEIRIVHVSNVMNGNSKGHIEVLKVVKLLKSYGKNVIVTFIGDGPSKNEYLELAKNYSIEDVVFFKGFVIREELRKILLGSNFFLFPSKTEGLPKVVIEAMALSLPCIASNVGGIPELLPQNNIFNSYDVEGMTKRIIELFSDKQLYTENSVLMYKTAKEYESTVLATRRREFYNTLVSLE